MDVCNRFGVHGRNSLYITGVGAYTDKEISQVFEVNGDISKIIRIPNEPGQPEGRVLVEYVSDRSISRIDPITLGALPSPKDPSVMWSVRTIRDVCQEEIGRELARRYLDELEAVAGSSRAGFLSILQSELQESPATTPHLQTSPTEPRTTQSHDTPVHGTMEANQSEPVEPTHFDSEPANGPVNLLNTDENTFNPPQIQRMIVEHVIRSEPTTSSPTQRIRTFSGRMPRPNGEVDYDTWRTQVDLLLCDPAINDTLKVRKILESLLSPAAEIVKPLGLTSPPKAYVIQLDSAFGVVEDGEELFAAFLSSNQNNGEKPSAYLNRLHCLITKAISRGGAPTENSNEHLLRQFCRGCWDQSIIIGLQLEHRKSNPPSFPELLLMLRTEEDRRSAKLDRMKKHLGSTKAAAHAHSVFDIPSYDHEPVSSPLKQNETSKLEKKVNELTKQVEILSQKPKTTTHDSKPVPMQKSNQSETSKLENRIAELTKQVEKLAVSQKGSEMGESTKKDCLVVSSNSMRKPFKVRGMPRAWFCFRCGEDNHIAAQCSNEPNPMLVRSKNAELKEKQERFRAQQAVSPFALNL